MKPNRLWLLLAVGVSLATAVRAAPLVTGAFPAPYATGPGDDLAGQLGWQSNDPADDLSFFVRWNGLKAAAVGGLFASPTVRQADFRHNCGEPLAGISFSVDFAFIASGPCEAGEIPGEDCFPGRDSFGWTFWGSAGEELLRVAFEPASAGRLEVVWYDSAGVRTSAGVDVDYGATYSLRLRFSAFGGDAVFTASVVSGSTFQFTGILAGSSAAVLGAVGFDFDVTGPAPSDAGDNMMIFNRLAVIPEPAVFPPTAASLVVSEINPHPPGPSQLEAGSPVTGPDDFEFVRLMNIGSSWLDLRQLRFSGGPTFDFSLGDVLVLPPGGSVLVLKRRTAYERRYGSTGAGTIAGQFAGSLADSGQTLTLEWGSGPSGSNAIVQSFAYGSAPQWPAAANGLGATLLLKNPAAAPPPGSPESWVASAQPGGLPGGTPRPMDFASWKALCFSRDDAGNESVSGLLADPDHDGLTNQLECLLGCYPRLPDDASRLPVSAFMQDGGQTWRTLEYRIQPGITGQAAAAEVSADMSNWTGGSGNIGLVSGPLPEPDGCVVWKVRDAVPVDAAPRRFIRLAVAALPPPAAIPP